jgi:plasmid stabilization system protein ParE
MPNTEEIRKTITNSTAVHFAAGTVDLAAEKLRELPATFDKLRSEAPTRIQSFRENELPRLREQAQTLAQQSAEAAKEVAAKARVTYDELAERGKGTVEEWAQRNGDRSVDDDEPQVVVERLKKVSDAVTEAGGEADASGAGDRGPQS